MDLYCRSIKYELGGGVTQAFKWIILQQLKTNEVHSTKQKNIWVLIEWWVSGDIWRVLQLCRCMSKFTVFSLRKMISLYMMYGRKWYFLVCRGIFVMKIKHHNSLSLVCPWFQTLYLSRVLQTNTFTNNPIVSIQFILQSYSWSYFCCHRLIYCYLWCKYSDIVVDIGSG